ncbi:MAG: tyrosine-type recombinase/integrase, partial [Muribaculaceae bacterium]|nr:tyrosine-type recombinase/integrase [Muribaculaceae bacterium]
MAALKLAEDNAIMKGQYCGGRRAADLIQLQWGNVTDSGRLHYQMGKNHKYRDLLLVEQAIEILRHYRREDAKATDYIFPLLSNDAEYAGCVTQTDKDRMRPELRHKMYQDISSKNALINKYLKKIAEQTEIEKPLSMHINRHSFAHIAQEAGTESSAIKNILGHSNLATTERYMGSFDTAKTDN